MRKRTAVILGTAGLLMLVSSSGGTAVAASITKPPQGAVASSIIKPAQL